MRKSHDKKSRLLKSILFHGSPMEIYYSFRGHVFQNSFGPKHTKQEFFGCSGPVLLILDER